MPRLFWSLALLLAACGDPLAGGDFAGDVQLKFQAIVCGSEDPTPALNPRLGILWKTHDGAEGWEITDATLLEETEFPALVEVELFAPPPSTAHLGCPILFDDLEGDEIFTESDPILAVSWNQLVGFKHDTYELLEGVCSEPGMPSGQMVPFQDRPIDISFLAAPDLLERPPEACVVFF